MIFLGLSYLIFLYVCFFIVQTWILLCINHFLRLDIVKVPKNKYEKRQSTHSGVTVEMPWAWDRNRGSLGIKF